MMKAPWLLAACLASTLTAACAATASTLPPVLRPEGMEGAGEVELVPTAEAD